MIHRATPNHIKNKESSLSTRIAGNHESNISNLQHFYAKDMYDRWGTYLKKWVQLDHILTYEEKPIAIVTRQV